MAKVKVQRKLYPVMPWEVGVVNSNYPYAFAGRFGAVGNDIADDTVALQNWLNSLLPGEEATSKGIYKTSNGLHSYTPGVKFRGLGAITGTADFIIGSVIHKTGDYTALRTSGYNVSVEDMSFIGPVRIQGSGVGVGHGLEMAGRGSVARRVLGRYNLGAGLLIYAMNAAGVPDTENTHYAKIECCWFDTNGLAGIRTLTPTSGDVNMNKIEATTCRHNDGPGVDHQSGSYWHFDLLDCEYNNSWGILFGKGSYTECTAVHTEQNQGGDATVDLGDGVHFMDGVIEVVFNRCTIAEGGAGADFEAGISYDPTCTQQNRDSRIGKRFYKNRYISSANLSDMHFEAYDYREINAAIAGFVGRVVITGVPWSGAFYVERETSANIRTKISAPTAAVPNGVYALGLNGAPASGNSALLLMVNDGVLTHVQQVSLGAVDSGGAGFKVLRVPNT